MPIFLLPISLCALVAPTDFAVFVTDGAGNGSVRMCSTDSPLFTVLPQLTGIRLLECVPASRTPLDESFSGRAQLRNDLEQGTRVQLPNARGSVYHYRRDDDSSSSYGFFSIDDGGEAHVLIELPAAPGPSDPFLSSVASKSSGSSLLVATQPNAGGDLWQLYTDGSPALNRTEGVPMLVFGRDSFFLSSDLGAAVTTTGVVRFDPHTSECADFVGFGPESTPPWLGLELMPSANGRYIAFIAGDSQAAARPFVVGTGGDAQCMNDVPDYITGAGCLPEVTDGPWLCVSDDGALCAWRVGQSHGYSYSHELFLARHDPGAQTLTLHVTQDALFEPYIDEIGLAYFRPGGQLVFMAGDPGENQALLSRADLFGATLDSNGVPAIWNLSLTSGEPAPPFLSYGALELFALRVRPSTGEALLYSRESASHRLLAVDPDLPGVRLVEDGVEGVGPIDSHDGDWYVGLDVPAAAHQTGLLLLEGGSCPDLEMLLELPTLASPTRFARNPFDHDVYACFSISPSGAAERATQVNGSSGATRDFSPRDLFYGCSLAFTHAGDVILSLSLASGDSFFVVWPPAPAYSHKVWMIPQPGFVLPGA